MPGDEGDYEDDPVDVEGPPTKKPKKNKEKDKSRKATTEASPTPSKEGMGVVS